MKKKQAFKSRSMYLRNQKKNCRWKFSSGKSSSSYHLTWTLDCLNSWSLSDPVDWMAAANWLVVVSQPIWKSMRKSKWGKSSPSFGVKIPKKKNSCHQPDYITCLKCPVVPEDKRHSKPPPSKCLSLNHHLHLSKPRPSHCNKSPSPGRISKDVVAWWAAGYNLVVFQVYV